MDMAAVENKAKFNVPSTASATAFAIRGFKEGIFHRPCQDLSPAFCHGLYGIDTIISQSHGMAVAASSNLVFLGLKIGWFCSLFSLVSLCLHLVVVLSVSHGDKGREAFQGESKSKCLSTRSFCLLSREAFVIHNAFHTHIHTHVFDLNHHVS